MVSDVRDRAADEPAIDSKETRKRSVASAGSSDRRVRVVLFWGVALDFDGFSSS